ncbi:hypothetical protein D3C73_1596610 [compost metagenome]
MLKLKEDPAVMAVYSPGQLFQAGNIQQIACVQLIGCTHPRLVVYTGNFRNNQTAAPCSTFFIVSNHLIRGFAAGRSQ